MIKGIQRQTVVIRTQESRYFEEVQFLLRSDYTARGGGDADMLREANRILEESGLYKEKRRRRSGRKHGKGVLPFFLGTLLGGGLASLFWLLLTVL